MPRPIPTLPTGIATADWVTFQGTVMDTSFVPPTGQDWPCHTSSDLANALKSAQPGDRILLDPGVSYVGNFKVGAKTQGATPQWLHITTAGFHAKHPPGARITPGAAADMAKIVSPNVSQAFSFTYGTPNTSYVRIYGVEFTSDSTYNGGSGYPPGRQYGYALVAYSGSWPPAQPIPDHIIFDRIYLHGSPTLDLQAGIQAGWNYGALIDSWIEEIHMAGTDTTAYGAFFTTGPHKIVNNHISAAGENIIFGGSGGNANPGVPSDIEVRFNHLYKPLSWIAPSTQSPITMTVKNSFELKSAQRVLLDRNYIENCWNAAQMGFAIVLTVRSGQSGDFAVVNDVTITNNVLDNVMSGFNGGGCDDTCGPSSVGGAYPNCHNAGSQARWFIHNNLILHADPTQTPNGRNTGIQFAGSIDRIDTVLGTVKDVVFSHNTFVPNPKAPNVFSSVYVTDPSVSGYPPAIPTHDVWIVDNVLQKQVTGDNGYLGMRAIAAYFPDMAAPYSAFQGNVMLQQTQKAGDWPPVNLVAPSILLAADYSLVSPTVQTTDGQLAGVDVSQLPAPPSGGVTDPTALSAVAF